MSQSEIKYDPDGAAYQIMIVRDNECLAMRDGRMWILPKSILSDDPPERADRGEIADAKIILTELHKRIETAQGTLTATERAAEERRTRLKQRPFLKNLDDLLAGRIRHFVEIRSSFGAPPQIITWDDVKTYRLTLSCDTNGYVEWKQNFYSDESGYTRTVIPCGSFDQAMAEARKLFAAHETDAMSPNCKTTPNRQWAKQAAKYDILMTDRYMCALEELEASAKQAKVAKLQSEIQTLKEDGGT